MNSSVAALIVSHDGARWLPAVIEGLGEQRAPVDAVVAVDTTSRDDSTELLRQAFGSVVEAHGSTSFPDAVTLGLEHVGDCEWVWLLHDDSRPDPGALEALLAAAEANPDADILGPSCASGPRCAGCWSSASPSAAPVAARPASNAASSTRDSTTMCAPCSR